MQAEMPEIPEFRPTEEEFADPLCYIRSIAAEGAKFVPLLFRVFQKRHAGLGNPRRGALLTPGAVVQIWCVKNHPTG